MASGAKELLGVGIIDPGFGQYQGLIKAKKAKSDFELRESFVAVLFSLFFFRCFFFPLEIVIGVMSKEKDAEKKMISLQNQTQEKTEKVQERR